VIIGCVVSASLVAGEASRQVRWRMRPGARSRRDRQNARDGRGTGRQTPQLGMITAFDHHLPGEPVVHQACIEEVV